MALRFPRSARSNRIGRKESERTMSDAISITEARERPGLRLLMLAGLPSPWSQAARGIFEVKGLAYDRVHAAAEEGAAALQSWTGQDSYPAAVYEEESARSGWAEILLLAERLAPTPALLPSDPEERARAFGISHEICGEMGLGWCRRLVTIADGIERTPPDPIATWLGNKYGYRPDSASASQQRVVDVLLLLDALLAKSRASNGRYLMGAELTAVDIYWATFCNLIAPLPPELMNMPEPMRPMFTATDPETLGALSKELLAHRDFVYQEHLTLPVEL
jgi:glutathione S-transferase